MQKLIKKLIERLEEEKRSNPCRNTQCKECEYTNECYEGEKCYKVGVDNIISIVNELAEEYINCSTDISTKSTDCSTKVSEMPTGWVPVSERFPKEDFYCIVTVEYTNGNKEVNFGWFDRASVCWYVGAGEFRTTNVLAWMPLPTPYTEGE